MVCSETPVQQWLHPLMSLLLIHAVETITAAVQRLNWTPVLSSCIKDQFRVDSHNSSFIWTLNRRAVGGFVCGGHLSISVERHHLGILKNKEGAFVNRRMFRCVCVLEENLASKQISGSAACVSALSMTRATVDLTCDRTWMQRCAQSLHYTRNQKHFIFYIYIYSFLNVLVWVNNMNTNSELSVPTTLLVNIK